jgi:hypothetical protein
MVIAGALAGIGTVAYSEFKNRAHDEMAELVLSDVAGHGANRAVLRSEGGTGLEHADFTPGGAYELTTPGGISTRFGEISVAVDAVQSSRAGLAMVSRSGRCARALLDAGTVVTSSGELQTGETCSGSATLLVGVAPPAPSVEAEPGLGSVRITWSAVEWPHVTRYVVARDGVSENYTHTPGGSYEFIEGSLEPGVTVRYTVRAENPYGSASTTVDVTPEGVPGAVVLSGAAGDGSVDLSWTEAGANGSAVSAYELEGRVGAGEWSAWGSVGGGELEVNVGDLVNGASYAFRIRAVNGYGAGAWSESVVLVPNGVPGAVGGLAAVAGTSTEAGNATVSWGVPTPQGGLASVQYEMQYSTNPTFTAAETTTVTSPHGLTGLGANTVYYVRVRAVNANGAGEWSTESVLTAPGTPGTPSLTPGTGSSFGSVSVSWGAPTGGAASYTVSYSTSAAFTGATTLSASSSPAVLSGLSGNTVYYVRVRAQNASGSGQWSGAANVLTSPGAVSGVSLVCPEGYNSSGVLMQVNTTSCTVAVSAGSGLSVSGTVTGPGGYSQSFTGTSYAAPSVPLADAFSNPMVANARQCNATGCGPWYGNVTRAAVPQPGVPGVTNLGCAFGHCQVRFSATKAWTYEVNLWGGNGTGVVRCLDVTCADASGSWPVGWDGTRYYSQVNNTLTGTRSFHVLDACAGQGGCSRDVLIPQGTWIRVSGANGYLNGALGWPGSGWCLPLGTGIEPILASCNWTTGPGVADWRGGYIYIG